LHKGNLFILSFSFVSVIVVVVGLLFWCPELLADRKLQNYVERLEEKGYRVEERLLADFHFDDSIRMKYCSDLTYAANWEGVHTVYFDREIQALYFLKPVGDRLETYIFNYMLAREE